MWGTKAKKIKEEEWKQMNQIEEAKWDKKRINKKKAKHIDGTSSGLKFVLFMLLHFFWTFFLILGLCVPCSWTTDFPCNFRHVCVIWPSVCFARVWTPCLEQVAFCSICSGLHHQSRAIPFCWETIFVLLGLFYCFIVVSFLCRAFWWCLAFLFLSLLSLLLFLLCYDHCRFLFASQLFFWLLQSLLLVVASGFIVLTVTGYLFW